MNTETALKAGPDEAVVIGRYRCVVADPPWPIKWTGGGAIRTNGRGGLASGRVGQRGQ